MAIDEYVSTQAVTERSNTVYKFGLQRPTENAPLVRALMRAGHEYRKRLVEIERERRTKVRELESQHGDLGRLAEEARLADERAEQAARSIRLERAKTRARSETAEMVAVRTAAKVARREAVDRLREARRLFRESPEVQLACDAIKEAAGAAVREARSHFPDYPGIDGRALRADVGRGAWGTYQLPEAAADKAHGSLPLYSGLEPNDPRFPRFTGEGRVGLQINGGMVSTDAFSVSSCKGGRAPVTIHSVADSRGAGNKKPGSRRSGHAFALRMRIGTDENKAPVWAEWPMTMHRPLPASLIMAVVVSLRKVGPRESWTVQFTLRGGSFVKKHDLAPEHGTVAVDVGWRLIDGIVRVCCWHGSDGAHGELRVPASMLAELKRVAKLRSGRDKDFDAARDGLKVRLDAIAQAPEWLRGATQSLHAWKAPGRLAALARRWKVNRFDGDAAAYDALEAWRYHDHHLWTWETSQQRKVLLHRREMYRIFGAELARKYHTVVWEDFDLRRIAVRAPTGENERENETARANRQAVSVSELREVVTHAFVSRDGETADVDPYQSTHICEHCGLVEAFDAAACITHRCGGCHAVWDQDENAAQVLLALHDAARERSRDAPNAGGARVTEKAKPDDVLGESPRARSKRRASERRARLHAARKSTTNRPES